MPDIKIYGAAFGSSFRPHWMLAELGLPYQTMPLDMSKGEHKLPAYIALNPAAQVPVMIYDDFVLTESAAIVWYLAEKHNPKLFGPQTPESHANLLRWELFTLLNLNPHFTTLALKNWGQPQGEEAEAKANEKLAKYLPVLEEWLKTRKYIVGDDFTVGDVVCRATFNYAEFLKYDLSAYPSITAWMARCAERPAFQKAAAHAATSTAK